MLLDVALDSILDVIKMIPIMFVVCLAGEFILTKKAVFLKYINSVAGVFACALVGLIPQCGVSVGFAELYVKRCIGFALIITVFLASSDEALIIAAGSYDFGFVAKLIVVKVLAAVFWGLILFFITKNKTQNVPQDDIQNTNGGLSVLIKTTVKTVGTITIYVLITVFVLNLAIEAIGLETIQAQIAKMGAFQVVAAAFIGLIPSCASSAFVTEAYVMGIISFGPLISGLCANTGYGIIVIFKALPLKKALAFTGILIAISIITGCLLMRLGI